MNIGKKWLQKNPHSDYNYFPVMYNKRHRAVRTYFDDLRDAVSLDVVDVEEPGCGAGSRGDGEAGALLSPVVGAVHRHLVERHSTTDSINQ